MNSAIVAAGLAAAAVAAASVIQRRRPDAPTQGSNYSAPTQIDRADFLRPDIDQIVVVFSSSTCDVCASVVDVAMQFASRNVAVHNVEYSLDEALHVRYNIDAVPTVVVADHHGRVTAAFTGQVSYASLRDSLGWATAPPPES